MNESLFHQRCDATYKQIETLLEERAIDFENNGDIIEIFTDDDETIVINKQVRLAQIWLASRQGGQHYQFTDEAWHNTRDGSELIAYLTQLL